MKKILYEILQMKLYNMKYFKFCSFNILKPCILRIFTVCIFYKKKTINPAKFLFSLILILTTGWRR